MKIYINKKILIAASILILSPVVFLLGKRIYAKTDSYILKAVAQTGQVQGVSGKNSYDLIAQEPTTNQPSVDPELVTISHQVSKGDTIYSIAQKYHADPQTILDYPYNHIADDLKLVVGETLIIPNGYISSPAPTSAPVIGTGQLAWPVIGTVSQYASWFHPGAIDIAIDIGTPIKAAANGMVLETNHYNTGYGNHVYLDNGSGLTTLYAHLTKTSVEKGQNVQTGDLIGLSGSTGRSTGPHLHFEVRRNGAPVDPMSLLKTL